MILLTYLLTYLYTRLTALFTDSEQFERLKFLFHWDCGLFVWLRRL